MNKKRLLFAIISLLFLVILILIISSKTYDNVYFNIETYKSHVDKDADGVDDATDILNGVREYIKTKPKYKSKYYETGYPNDSYGVCTDVVVQGLLNAGYNLMELVHEDILKNPDAYSIQNIDKRIDFRRVKNLEVYFKNNAISLTTDIYNIKEWQGGDIVLFQNHIGIISDKRNKKGITYVIHHTNPFQFSYEEDILEKRDDLIGHYRVS